VKLIAKHLPLLALALLVCSTELRAEESQVPFKVGDVVALSFADTNGACVFIVKQIKGRWIAQEGTDIIGKKGGIYRWDSWINTDYCTAIEVNPPEYLSRFGFTQPIPNPNTKPTFTYSVINGKTNVTTNSQTTNASIQGAPPAKVFRRRVWPKDTNAPQSPSELPTNIPTPLPAPEKSTEKGASKD
jgi:hypothetical protein